MRKISLLVSLIILLAANHFAQDYRQIADGIEYAEMLRGTEKEPIRLNLLRLDLTKARLDVVHAMDAGVGVEKTSSIAARHGAIAAINAGFFKMDGVYKGDNVGTLMINNELVSESYGGRSVLEIVNLNDKTLAFLERVNVQSKVYIGKNSLDVGINRSRGEDDAVLYKSSFHQTTLTNPNGAEIIVKKNRVIKIIENKGSNPIPTDGFVISVSGKKRQEFINLLKIGKKVTTGFAVSSPVNRSSGMFGASEDAVAGVPQLVKNGKIDITWQEEKTSKDFVETKHPRTAVAKLKDGKFLMVTVDGRQPAHSVGINLPDLAALLLELGATEAMNLDGGGSTTMFLDGKVVNKPSDKTGEREVSDAILVFPRR